MRERAIKSYFPVVDDSNYSSSYCFGEKVEKKQQWNRYDIVVDQAFGKVYLPDGSEKPVGPYRQKLKKLRIIVFPETPDGLPKNKNST